MNNEKKVISLQGRKNLCGKKIRAERMKTYHQVHKLSQAALARLMTQQGYPISRVTICRIEKGLREVSDIELLYFANALGVDMQRLTCGNYSMGEMVQRVSESGMAGGVA